eukprot:6261134-Pyramimonas_sp.AAC.1
MRSHGATDGVNMEWRARPRAQNMDDMKKIKLAYTVMAALAAAAQMALAPLGTSGGRPWRP